MSGTHLFYNGVLLRDCETQEFRQDVQMDESGTDVLYSRVRITVTSTLVSLCNIGSGSNVLETGVTHPSTIAIPRVDGETIVERLREVQTRLQEVRKDFWYAVNAATKKSLSQQTGYDPNGADLPIPATDASSSDSYRVVLAATGLTEDDIKKLRADRNASIGKIKAFNPSGLTQSQFVDIDRAKVIDLNNGPFPISVSVEKVLGGRALAVAFTIEVCRCFCKPTDDLVPPVLDAAKAKGIISNRWGVSDSIDGDGSLERTISGKLIVADRSYQPHAMRLMVMPTLLPQAKWVSRHFATDPKGLSLEYRLAQKTSGPAAPEGVASWSGTYTETNAFGNNQTTGDIRVKVVGKSYPGDMTLQAQKTMLLSQAYNIVRSRVRFLQRWDPLPGQNPKTVITLKTNVVETMHRPELELHMSFLYRDLDGNGHSAVDGFGLRLKNMGADLSNSIQGYDYKWWPAMTTLEYDMKAENTWANSVNAGSVYDTYFQTPCSEWHGMPRGHYLGSEANRPTLIESQSNNGTASNRDTVLVSNTVTTPIPSLELPPPGTPILSTLSGFSVNQGAFSYLSVELDTRYDIDSGRVQLPTSKTRPYSTGLAGSYNSTSVVVQLHAGLCQRKITMIASRHGNWPQVPAPVAVIAGTTSRQEFLRGSMIPMAPEITKDGQDLIYKVQIQWVYAVNRLPQVGDNLMVGSSPIDKTTPAGNAIPVNAGFMNDGTPIQGFFDFSGSIESLA